MQVDWELSLDVAVPDGHGVRAAAVLPCDDDNDDSFSVVVGTQGGSLVVFGVPSGHITPVPYQHNHAVTAVLAATTTTTSVYVTGCKDAVVRIFDAQTHELQFSLEGHEKPVTSLAWCSSSSSSSADPYAYLLTGSWDGSCKVWDMTKRALVATLANHENSVCCVGLPSDDHGKHLLYLATGSAGTASGNLVSGHTVRLWSVNPTTGETKQLHSVSNDHQGPIRGICRLDATTGSLATCSNDGTVKLRAADTGTCFSTLAFVAEQQQHPPMLLSVTTIDNDSFIAASAEDGQVVLWNATTSTDSTPQVLAHAGNCVWNVVDLPPSSDLGTCCDDGHFRIFTRAAERMAPAAQRAAFAEAAVKQKQQSGPSPAEVAKLPVWESNAAVRGTSEGQVQLFQKQGVAIAAQWSMASQTWIEVGQVMGSSSSGDNNTIDGVTYDHVLPIEVDQTGGGVANLQIGYNNGENPFVAAQRFIDAHMLPQYHLAEIADYIQQRVGGSSSAGVPTIGEATATAAPAATTGIPLVSFPNVTIAAYKSFALSDKTAKTTLEKIKTKILEHKEKLTDAQTVALEHLLQTLLPSTTTNVVSSDDQFLVLLSYILEEWPAADAFPALDLARMLVLHPDAAVHTAQWTRICQRVVVLVVVACRDNETTAGLQGPAAVAIPMLSLRLFANAFVAAGAAVVAPLLDDMVSAAELLVGSNNKNVRLSVATVLYNVCHYASTNPLDPALTVKILTVANRILSSRSYEGEAVLRTLQAVGTLLISSPQVAKDAAKQLFLASKVEMAASPHGAQAKAAAKEVYALLS